MMDVPSHTAPKTLPKILTSIGALLIFAMAVFALANSRVPGAPATSSTDPTMLAARGLPRKYTVIGNLRGGYHKPNEGSVLQGTMAFAAGPGQASFITMGENPGCPPRAECPPVQVKYNHPNPMEMAIASLTACVAAGLPKGAEIRTDFGINLGGWLKYHDLAPSIVFPEVAVQVKLPAGFRMQSAAFRAKALSSCAISNLFRTSGVKMQLSVGTVGEFDASGTVGEFDGTTGIGSNTFDWKKTANAAALEKTDITGGEQFERMWASATVGATDKLKVTVHDHANGYNTVMLDLTPQITKWGTVSGGDDLTDIQAMLASATYCLTENAEFIALGGPGGPGEVQDHAGVDGKWSYTANSSFDVDTSATFNKNGGFSKAAKSAKAIWTNFNVKVRVTSPACKKVIQGIGKAAVERCPITQLFRGSGIKINAIFVKA